MLDAERSYVDMALLMERAGQRVAELLGCEAAHITPGAAAALALGTAACITGSDVDKVARLPDTSGLKNTVLIQTGQHYHYEHAVAVPGARLVDVGDANGTSAAQLEAALTPNVATILFPAHLDGAPGTLSQREVKQIANAHGVPVLADSAGRVYPIDSFKWHAREGADLAAFGAKYLGALNASGILCGRRDLVAAAVANSFIGFETVAWGKSFGRPLKLDRQTIVAVVAALEEWLETDHEARVAGYERRLQAISQQLAGAPGVTIAIKSSEGPSPRVLHLTLDGQARLDGAALNRALWTGTPAIAAVHDAPNGITINPVTVRPDEDERIAARLLELLS
jgi:L-seryl-tRNA(Ser) seleniumtransferase